MNISKTNKIIITAGAFFIILTLFVAFGLRPKNNKDIEEIKLISDYEIIEQDSEKLIKSNEAGFSLSLPVDWFVGDFEEEISFYSSEIKIKPDKTLAESMQEQNVCYGSLKIRQYISQNHNDINDLSDLIHKVEKGEIGKEGDYIFALSGQGGKTFLKTTFFKDGRPIYISLKALDDNKIYYINFGPFSSQECEQLFDLIFKSVKIE